MLMKNKLFFSFLCATMCSLCAAFAQEKYIGYTTGSFVRSNGIKLSTDTKMGMAIHLSQEKAELLKGKTINGVRAMFGTKQISDFKIFVTKELGGTPISETAQSSATTSLKNYYFDTPVTITGEEIYVGYTFTLSTENYKPLMVDYTSDFNTETVYSLVDGEWIDLNGQNVGGPAVQLILNDTPEINDLVIKPFNATKYYRGGDDLSLSSQLFNFGTTTVTSFEITTRIGEQEPQTQTITDVNIEPNTVYDFSLPGVNASTEGFTTVSIEITKVNEEDDADMSDNVASNTVYLYPSTMQRKFLIENFTGQACSNCPRGHQEINNVISGREDDFVIVSHHAGYEPDTFTMTEDGNLTWFYNSGGSTYAPAAMVDRYPYSAGETTCVFGSSSSGLTSDMQSAIALREVIEPYISVGLQNTYDPETRLCKVDVVVHTYHVPSSEMHTLNLWLTQDGITASQSGTSSNYSHDHVFRASLTETWGTPIELNEGETIVKSFEYTLPEEIASTYSGTSYTGTTYATVPENMHWVAFVGDITASPTSCTVWNSNTIGVTENGATTAIQSANVADNKSHLSILDHTLTLSHSNSIAHVYTISGQILTTLKDGQSISLPQGVYVIKMQGGNTQKVVIK